MGIAVTSILTLHKKSVLLAQAVFHSQIHNPSKGFVYRISDRIDIFFGQVEPRNTKCIEQFVTYQTDAVIGMRL